MSFVLPSVSRSKLLLKQFYFHYLLNDVITLALPNIPFLFKSKNVFIFPKVQCESFSSIPN